MNEDLRRMNVLQTLDELAHHDGRDKAREILSEWQDKNPVSESSSSLEDQVLKAVYESGIHQYIPAVLIEHVKDGIGIGRPSRYLINFSKKLLEQNQETQTK